MNTYQRIIAIGALIGNFLASGCGKQQVPSLEGTVKEEFGNVTRVETSSGALFGNESVKIGDPEYGIVLESNGRRYVITVRDSSDKPILSLAKAIEPGDRVRIELRPLYTNIGEDGIGSTYGSQLIVLK